MKDFMVTLPSGRVIDILAPRPGDVEVTDILEQLERIRIYDDLPYTALHKMYNTYRYMEERGLDHNTLYAWFGICSLYSFNCYDPKKPLVSGFTELPNPIGIIMKEFLRAEFSFPNVPRTYTTYLEHVAYWEASTMYEDNTKRRGSRGYEHGYVGSLSTDSNTKMFKSDIYDKFNFLKRRHTR